MSDYDARVEESHLEDVAVYIAGRYSRRAEFAEYADALRKTGYIVTSRWLNGESQRHGVKAARAVEEAERSIPEGPGSLFAIDDCVDIYNADVFMVFTEATPVIGEHIEDTRQSRGGRHVELGIALVLGMPIVMIGPNENVFCCLPRIRRTEQWGLAVLELLHECGESVLNHRKRMHNAPAWAFEDR